MLFMVIERFRNGKALFVGERFKNSGRMLPDGVTHHVSWMDLAGNRCFLIMEAPDRGRLNLWASRWHDLVTFDIVPVRSDADFSSNVGLSRVVDRGERENPSNYPV